MAHDVVHILREKAGLTQGRNGRNFQIGDGSMAAMEVFLFETSKVLRRRRTPPPVALVRPSSKGRLEGEHSDSRCANDALF